MDSRASPSKPIPFRSKKKLVPKPSGPAPLASKTPEKHSSGPTTRARNRGVALSISDIRKAALNLRESTRDLSPGDRSKSVKRRIISCDSPVKKPKKWDAKLPQKYGMLVEFFNSLDSSIRLMRLRGSMPTFTNVRPKIAQLTDWTFTYKHLSQLKFILPEALEFKKVLLFDERTNCMKPDIHITLNADAIEKDGKSKSETGSMNMREVFRSRLLDFVNEHPEAEDVPEGPLPEPFSKSMRDRYSDMVLQFKSSSPIETLHEESVQLPLANASHLSPKFQRRFSRGVTGGKNEIYVQTTSKPSVHSLDLPSDEQCEDEMPSEDDPNSSSPLLQNEMASETHEKHFVESSPMESSTCSWTASTPDSKKTFSVGGDNAMEKNPSIDTTPAKLASTPAMLMAATPALSTPKRRYMSPEDSSNSTPDKSVKHPPRTQSRMKRLNFDTPVKVKKVEAERDMVHMTRDYEEVHDILPKSLIQSIRAKEKKTMEENDPVISQAKKRREIIAALPKLFNAIHFMFKSSRSSIFTKEELIHKVIHNRLDIIDRRELEDQLEMMKELVPEWISEKLASTGDLLLCVNKMSDPDTIRKKLAEMK